MNKKIGIIGLGYVGLPLAVEFSNKFNTVGFDINEKRVSELNNYIDKALEIDNKTLIEKIVLPAIDKMLENFPKQSVQNNYYSEILKAVKYTLNVDYKMDETVLGGSVC